MLPEQLTRVVSEEWPQDAFPHQQTGRVPEFDPPPAVRKEALASLSPGNRTLQMGGCDEWLQGLQAERAGFTSHYSFSMYTWSRVGRLSAGLGVPNVFDTATACALLDSALSEAKLGFARGLLSHIMLCVYSDLSSWPEEPPHAAEEAAERAQTPTELAALLRQRLPYFELTARLVRMMTDHRKQSDEALAKSQAELALLRRKLATVEKEKAKLSDEVRGAKAEARALLTGMNVANATKDFSGKLRMKAMERTMRSDGAAALETMVGLNQSERIEAVTALCSTLDDGKIELMIPQLFRSLSQPSALLITQLIKEVDGSRLAEVLGSFADVLPMGARVFLFAKLLNGLTEEERGNAFGKLCESWGDKQLMHGAQLVLAMEASARMGALRQVIGDSGLDADDR